MTNYSNIAVQTTLAAPIGAGDLTLAVVDASGYPAAPFRIVLDPGSVVAEEVCEVTNVAATVFTVTRGFDGTTAKSHAGGATVIHAVVAADLTDLQAADTTHAADTTDVHGIADTIDLVLTDDNRLSDSRTPLAHASTHVGAGSDPITIAESQVTGLVADLAAKQPLDSDLTAIAALTTTSYGRALLALADAAALRTAGGLVIGTNVQAPATTLAGYGITDAQPLDSDLTAIAALSTTSYGRSLLEAANASALRTLAGLGSLATLSSVTASLISDASANGQSLITAANYSAMRTLLSLVPGTDVQAQDTELAAIAGLTSAADRLPYFTGAGTAALATFTAAGRALVDDTDAAAQLATLGANKAGVMTEYTSTTTDTLPAGYTFVQWEIWGAGGGGGSGRRGATGNNRGGGGGGGGGGYVITPAYLISDSGGAGTSVVNTIGAGGSIGAAQTGNDLDGNSGGNGGLTSVAITGKLIALVGGGSGGGGGTTAGGTAGAPAAAALTMSTPGVAGAGATVAGGNAGNGAVAGTGGGGGGGLDTGDTIRAGGIARFGAGIIGEGGSVGASGGTAGGGTGSNTTSANISVPLPVSSGSGGGSNNAGAGGNGGTGGRGCGGGGGGASQNGANSGAGGLGGAGYIRRYVW